MRALNAIPRRTHRQESYGLVIGGPMISALGKLRTMPRFTKRILVNDVEVSRGGVSPDDGVSPFFSNCYKSDEPLPGVTVPPYPWKRFSGHGFAYRTRQRRFDFAGYEIFEYRFTSPCLVVVRDTHGSDGMLDVSVYGAARRTYRWQQEGQEEYVYESNVAGASFTFPAKVDGWNVRFVPREWGDEITRWTALSFGRIEIKDIEE